MSNPNKEDALRSEYRRLRAAYDAAFARLRAEQATLRRLAHPSGDKPLDGELRRRVEEALFEYRRCREQLVRFLVSLPRYRAEESRAALPETIRRLAYQLWEKEGQPEGRANEHWARAEQLLRKTA